MPGSLGCTQLAGGAHLRAFLGRNQMLRFFPHPSSQTWEGEPPALKLVHHPQPRHKPNKNKKVFCSKDKGREKPCGICEVGEWQTSVAAMTNSNLCGKCSLYPGGRIRNQTPRKFWQIVDLRLHWKCGCTTSTGCDVEDVHSWKNCSIPHSSQFAPVTDKGCAKVGVVSATIDIGK